MKILKSLTSKLFSWPMILFSIGVVVGVTYTYEYTRGIFAKITRELPNNTYSYYGNAWNEFDGPEIPLLIIFTAILLLGKLIRTYTIKKR